MPRSRRTRGPCRYSESLCSKDVLVSNFATGSRWALCLLAHVCGIALRDRQAGYRNRSACVG